MEPFVFTTPAGQLNGVKAFGQGGPPAAGWYAVDILGIVAFPDNANSGSLRLTIPSVAEYGQVAHASPERAEGDVWAYWNLAVENPTNDQKIADNNERALKGQVSVLASLGYSAAQIAQGPVSHLWLVPRADGTRQRCYIKYIPKEMGDNGASQQVDFVTKEQFLANYKTGAPTRKAASGTQAGTTAPPAGGGYTAPPPPPMGGAVAAPPAPPPPAAGAGGGGYAAPPPPPPR